MRSVRSFALTAVLAGMLGSALASEGCAARTLPPARVGSAEAAVQAARADGAEAVPEAALHLRLATDQIARARRLIREGEPERAEPLLVRAESDAALADALAREAQQKAAADAVADRARAASEGDAP